jgi:hypothetical protein
MSKKGTGETDPVDKACAFIRMNPPDTSCAGAALNTCTAVGFPETYILDKTRLRTDYDKTEEVDRLARAGLYIRHFSFYEDNLANVYRTMQRFTMLVELPPYVSAEKEMLRDFVRHCRDNGRKTSGQEASNKPHRFALVPTYAFHSHLCALLFMMWHVFVSVMFSDWFTGTYYRGTYIVCTLIQREDWGDTDATGKKQYTIVIPAERSNNSDKTPAVYGGIQVQYTQPSNTGALRHFMNMIARERLGFWRLLGLILYCYLITFNWWSLAWNPQAALKDMASRGGWIAFYVIYFVVMAGYNVKYFIDRRGIGLIPFAPLLAVPFFCLVLYAKLFWAHGHASTTSSSGSFKMPVFDPIGYAKGRLGANPNREQEEEEKKE